MEKGIHPYLGMRLPSDLTQLYKLNFLPFLQSLENDLQRCLQPCTSWFCKVKMNTLPHLLYLMQVVPIRLPSRYLRTLQKMIVRFVWSGTRPRLKYALLCARKGELACRISGCIIELAYLVALWNWGVTYMQRPGSRRRKA